MDAKTTARLQVRHEFPGLAGDMIVRVGGEDRGRLVRGDRDQWTPVLDGLALDGALDYSAAVDAISSAA